VQLDGDAPIYEIAHEQPPAAESRPNPVVDVAQLQLRRKTLQAQEVASAYCSAEFGVDLALDRLKKLSKISESGRTFSANAETVDHALAI
jgi:hypothetical protein